MIGIDLVQLEEFSQQMENVGDIFTAKLFLPSELQNRRVEHLAGVFAAKEAVIKACRLPINSWQHIEIATEESGAPYAKVNSHIVNVSIAHHGEYVIAVAQTNDQD